MIIFGCAEPREQSSKLESNLIAVQSVSARMKEKAQLHVFLLFPSTTLKHLEPKRIFDMVAQLFSEQL